MSEPTTKKAAEKQVQAFYTRKEAKGPAVEIYLNAPVEGKRIPEFGGKVDGKKVHMRVRKSAKGGFLSVLKSVKTDEVKDNKPVYKEEQVGTANLVVNDKGMPRLAIKMTGKEDTIWASVKKAVPNELLERAGLDFTLMAKKQAEAAKKAAEAPKAKAPAPKP